MRDFTADPALTVDQCELLMMHEPFLSSISHRLSEDTGKALDKLTTDAGAFYGAGNWTVQTTGEQIHVPSPNEGEEPTVARTNAIMQAAHRELAPESALQNELGALMREMGMPPRLNRRIAEIKR